MSGGKPAGLARLLRGANLKAAALSVITASALLVVITFVSLRTQVSHNLELIGRTIAYSSEAAVMFRDREAASEILSRIARDEGLLEAQIIASDGTEIASYRGGENAIESIVATLGRIVFADQTLTEIRSAGLELGRVSLRSDGSVFAVFFVKLLTAVLFCLLLATAVSALFSRQMVNTILGQLDAFASTTHLLRIKRDYRQRLPTFEVAEFDHLGKDVNALLDEIEYRNVELLARGAQLEEVNQSLSHLALHDALTGLSNRRQFGARLNQTIAAAQVAQREVALLYLDSDGFKAVNDVHGHEAGDALLIEIGARLRDSVRDSDLVARLGGDEFAVILDPVKTGADAVKIAEKILANVRRPVSLPGGSVVTPGMSIGVALFPEHGNTAEGLIRAADHAMYAVKRAGRGHFHMFSPLEAPTPSDLRTRASDHAWRKPGGEASQSQTPDEAAFSKERRSVRVK